MNIMNVQGLMNNEEMILRQILNIGKTIKSIKNDIQIIIILSRSEKNFQITDLRIFSNFFLVRKSQQELNMF